MLLSTTQCCPPPVQASICRRGGRAAAPPQRSMCHQGRRRQLKPSSITRKHTNLPALHSRHHCALHGSTNPPLPLLRQRLQRRYSLVHLPNHFGDGRQQLGRDWLACIASMTIKQRSTGQRSSASLLAAPSPLLPLDRRVLSLPHLRSSSTPAGRLAASQSAAP